MIEKESVGRLSIGLDESNHGRYPETLVAVSSCIPGDITDRTDLREKRMNSEEVQRFIRNGRDYVFMNISLEQMPEGYEFALIRFAPVLIERLLVSPRPNTKPIFTLDNIMLDGYFEDNEIKRIIGEMKAIKERLGLNVETNYRIFPKKGRYKYNRLLMAADSLAHSLFKYEKFRARARFEGREIVLPAA